MTLLLLAAFLLGIAGLIFHLERKDRRHAQVVADLCQRIQAPDTAVAQHAVPQFPSVQHLPFDDDGAWLAHVQELNGRE